MERLQQLLNTLREFEVKGIYIDDELKDFSDFLKAFEHIDIEKVIQEQDENTFYLLLSNAIWHKLSVNSIDEEELDICL